MVDGRLRSAARLVGLRENNFIISVAFAYIIRNIAGFQWNDISNEQGRKKNIFDSAWWCVGWESEVSWVARFCLSSSSLHGECWTIVENWLRRRRNLCEERKQAEPATETKIKKPRRSFERRLFCTEKIPSHSGTEKKTYAVLFTHGFSSSSSFRLLHFCCLDISAQQLNKKTHDAARSLARVIAVNVVHYENSIFHLFFYLTRHSTFSMFRDEDVRV